MLRLRTSILSNLLPSLSTVYTSPLTSLHRLLSATAAAPISSPNHRFRVEDYLIATCGLTRAQALKASTKLVHLKSPSKPDAVLAFLRDLGLSSADVAAVVAKDPQFLCASVERTLAPNVVDLTNLGIPHSEIAGLVPLALGSFRQRSICRNLEFLLPIFGSVDQLLRVVKNSFGILSVNLEKVVRPNIDFLRERGLGACHIASLCIHKPRLVSSNPKRLRAMVARAEGLGVRGGSGAFVQALYAAAFNSEKKIAAKVEYLKKMFRWSDAEVLITVSRFPVLLNFSEDALQQKSKFLISEVGLEPVYIAHRPVMLGFSLKGRLRPRYHVLKFLKANELLDPDRDYYNAVSLSENLFMKRFINPREEAVPGLAEDYAAACIGELPTRFRFA